MHKHKAERIQGRIKFYTIKNKRPHSEERDIKIIIFDIQNKLGNLLTTELKEQGFDVSYFEGDVIKEKDHIELIENVVSRFGKIDFVCNNAGIEQKPTPLINLDEQIFNRLVDVNLKGVWLGRNTKSAKCFYKRAESL